MKKLINVFALITMLSAIVSCSNSNEPSESENGEKYFPLAVGNIWNYEHYEYNEDGETKEVRQFYQEVVNKYQVEYKGQIVTVFKIKDSMGEWADRFYANINGDIYMVYYKEDYLPSAIFDVDLYLYFSGDGKKAGEGAVSEKVMIQFEGEQKEAIKVTRGVDPNLAQNYFVEGIGFGLSQYVYEDHKNNRDIIKLVSWEIN